LQKCLTTEYKAEALAVDPNWKTIVPTSHNIPYTCSS